MALVTREIGRAYDPGDPALVATLEIDYDDGDLRVRTVRIVNGTTLLARVTARRTDGTGPTRTLEAPAGQTVSLAVGTIPAQRLQLVVDSRGRLDGVDYTFGLF